MSPRPNALLARLGARTMIMTGTAAMAGGYAWLSGIGSTDTYLGAVFGPMVIAGLATGFVFMPITATVLGGVEPEHAGSASGLLQTTQQLGSAVGVAAIVSVYAAGAVPGEFVPGLSAAFLTSAGFAAAGLLVTALALRPAPAPVDAADPAGSSDDDLVEPVAAEAA